MLSQLSDSCLGKCVAVPLGQTQLCHTRWSFGRTAIEALASTKGCVCKLVCMRQVFWGGWGNVEVKLSFAGDRLASLSGCATALAFTNMAMYDTGVHGAPVPRALQAGGICITEWFSCLEPGSSGNGSTRSYRLSVACHA